MQFTGGDLAERGVGALARVLPGDFNPRAPVGAHRHAGSRRGDMGRIAGGGAAIADQPIAVSHRPRARIALAPSEARRSRVVTLHQRSAGEPRAVDGALADIVDAAQLDRIHGELDREFVHRAFQRIHIRHLDRRAHEARGLAIGLDHVDAGRDRRLAVHDGRDAEAGERVVVVPRLQLPALMPIGEQMAVVVRREPDVVLGLGAVRRQRKTLIARHDVANRAGQVARGASDQRGPLRHETLTAERAADIRIDDVNRRRLDTQHRGGAVGQFDDELTRLMDRQLAVRPRRGRRIKLDRVLVLRGR